MTPGAAVAEPTFSPDSAPIAEAQEAADASDVEAVDMKCQLMLVLEADARAPARLDAALAAGTIASVNIVPAADATLDAHAVRGLVDAAQAAGTAALIAGDAQLARTLKSDGVHLPAGADEQACREAREIVGSRMIVGCDAGRSRDAAMRLGEAGADYVGFGIPGFVTDRATARGRRLDLVQWWAEIFEVPCVAFDVEAADDTEALARAGADFVALRLPISMTPADARDAVSAVLTALATHTA